MSQPAGEFSPESTYFDEREKRIVGEIEAAKKKIEVVKADFIENLAALTSKRDAVLTATARLRSLRMELSAIVAANRRRIQTMAERVAECEILHDHLAEMLAPADLDLGKLNAEIAKLEEARDKRTAKPEHEIESLEARLGRLRLRRSIAMKQLQKESDTAPAVEPTS